MSSWCSAATMEMIDSVILDVAWLLNWNSLKIYKMGNISKLSGVELAL